MILINKLMTKKKKPNSPSPFDDLKMDDDRFEKLFQDENSLENTTQYLDDLLNTTIDQFSNTLDKIQPSSPMKTPPQKNPHLTSIKQDFPAESNSKPSKNSHPTPEISSDLPTPTVNTTSNTMPPQKKPTVNSLAQKKPPSSIQKRQSMIKKTSPSPQPKRNSSKINLINNLKKTFHSFSNIFNTPSKSISKDVSSPPNSHSMDESLDRLKKREEDIKKLLDNDKGNIS